MKRPLFGAKAGRAKARTGKPKLSVKPIKPSKSIVADVLKGIVR
jgi:hypothetical protein